MKSVFISSTFKDMQAERDLLHEKIFPRLRRMAAEYGEDVQELDLRWGVDTADMTEEESGHMVLKVCIDAIDRCVPYIIVLLGERYGWIPGDEIVASANDMRVDAYYQPGMSITNLEIRYGALREKSDLEHCVFCMRGPSVIGEIDPEYRSIYESESEEHRRKLSDLKAAIRGMEDAVVLDYEAKWDRDRCKISGLDTFGEELYRILEQMIRREYKDFRETGWQERVLLEIKRTKEQYLSSYVERPVEEAGVCRNIQAAVFLQGSAGLSCNLVKVKGAAGTGKSALMAACAQRLEKAGYPVILYFAGNPGCQNPDLLKQMLICGLERITQSPHREDGMTLDERLSELDTEAKDRKVICFIDALDQLYEKEKEPELDFVRICPHLIFVVSSLDDFAYTVPVGKTIFPWLTEVRELTRSGQEQVMLRTAGRRGKKLDDVLMGDIAAKESSSNPLYLSSILQRFFMMDGKEFGEAERLAPGMDGIHCYMEKLLAGMPDRQEDMVLYLLKAAMDHFEAEYLYEVLCLITLSRSGLTETELSDLLRTEGKAFAQIRFQQLASYLYEAFVQKEDGKWTFRHRLFREALQRQMSAEEKERCMESFVQYAKENKAFLKQEGFYYVLEQKSRFGGEILEDSGGFEPDRLGGAVAELAERDPSYELYFLELADAYPTDAFAAFWQEKFGKYAYRKQTALFHIRMLRKLSGMKEISGAIRCRCLKKAADFYAGRKEYGQVRQCIRDMEQLLDKLPEAERELQTAVMYRIKATVSSLADQDMAGSMEYQKSALEHLERAELRRPEDEEICYQKARVKEDLYWDYADTEQKTRPEILESSLQDILRNKKDLDHSDLARQRIAVLGDLAVCYCDRAGGHFDERRSRSYADEALKLARELVKNYPAVNNMRMLVRILRQVAYAAGTDSRYPFDQEAYQYCKKMYESCGTLDAKEGYARQCWAAGLSAAAAQKPDVRKMYAEAIRLYGELAEECPEEPEYRRFFSKCKLEIMQFELESDGSRDVCEKILSEVRPVAENLLKTGPDRYIYDAFELLADASASLDRFSEMERDARIMADASSRLFEKKPAKWNRRRLFKSHVYQALGLYHNGKDPEPVLEAAYREYRELDEDAWAEQKVLAHLLYDMYIQVLLEKRATDRAAELYRERRALKAPDHPRSYAAMWRQAARSYYDRTVLQWEESAPSAGEVDWSLLSAALHEDQRKKKYLAGRVGDRIRKGDFTYLPQIIRNCFLAGEYELAADYLEKMEENGWSGGDGEEQRLLRVLCRFFLLEGESDPEKQKSLGKSVKEMRFYQELSGKAEKETDPFGSLVRSAADEAMLFAAEGKEKGELLGRLLKCVSFGTDADPLFGQARHRSRARMAELLKEKDFFADIPAEDMAALGRKLDEFVGNLGTAAGRMKIRINIADRLRASEQEEYRDMAGAYYRKTFYKEWNHPKQMTVEEMQMGMYAYEQMVCSGSILQDEWKEQYVAVLLEYYERTRDENVWEKILEDPEYLKRMKFQKQVQMRAVLRRHMSEAEKELFDRMLEEKGREELAAVERELAEEVK